MGEFRMPSLGADMTEGTLLVWMVHPGDTVHTGDVVAEVDTTKAAIEVECFEDGVIGEILVDEGVTVPVGTPLATIEPARTLPPRPEDVAAQRVSPGNGSGPKLVVESPKPAAAAPETPRAPVAHDHTPQTGIRATPLVRKLAAEAGIDLGEVHGSAPGGRIVRADVEHAVERQQTETSATAMAAPRPSPRAGRAGRASGYARRLARELGVDVSAVVGSGPGGAVRASDVRAAASPAAASPAAASETVTAAPESVRKPADLAGAGPVAEVPHHDPVQVRKLIAAAMERSKRTVPHYYLSSTIDMDAALRWLREFNRGARVTARILPAALLLVATARAAKAVPDLNGHWIDDEFRPAADVHLGVVVSMRGGGIIVPTIPDADRLVPADMMAALRGVAERARAVRLRAADATPATITVTNLGDLGVDSVYGVIAAPQVAIAGFGAVTERPCAIDGLLGVRAQVTATLSADHRATDGAIGARFLHALSDLLQHPEEL
ncbi:2-oxo acid dehydrogenase subunit E2 [Nocardia sp. NPDC051981]|uniref:2-oxo acid dehydrogenase subunit E2 n=1 Tax=Nocardia sp. NPDC051981 TaxID=3155417 RepID=UPI0034368061